MIVPSVSNNPSISVTKPISNKIKSAPPSVIGSPSKSSPISSFFSSMFPSLQRHKQRSTLSLPDPPILNSSSGRRSSDASLLDESGSEVPLSPLQQFGKEPGSVSILPNKISVANLGCQQQTGRRDNQESKNKSTSLNNDNLSPGNLKFNQVPRSDPELFSSGKPLLQNSKSNYSIFQFDEDMESGNSKFVNKRSKVMPKIIHTFDTGESTGSLTSSPLSSRKGRLKVPKIKKSNSFTHLADALHQIHSVCLNPTTNNSLKVGKNEHSLFLFKAYIFLT